MRWMLMFVLAAMVAGCAGPGVSEEDREKQRIMRDADARDQERLCREKRQRGIEDPRCPVPPEAGAMDRRPPARTPQLPTADIPPVTR